MALAWQVRVPVRWMLIWRSFRLGSHPLKDLPYLLYGESCSSQKGELIKHFVAYCSRWKTIRIYLIGND